MGTKGILIDMGDTLIRNNNIDFSKSVNYLYNISSRCNCDKETFIVESLRILNDIFKERKIIEFKMIEYIELLMCLYDLSFDKNIEEIEEEFAYKSCEINMVEDAEQILQYFKKKHYKIILMSNTSFGRKIVLKMLGNLVDYFDDIIISSETVFRKPSGYFFDIGIRKLLLNKKDIYYIGNDFYYDVYGSSEAGINSIWFNEKCVKKDTKLIVENFIEIQKYSQLIDKNF